MTSIPVISAREYFEKTIPAKPSEWKLRTFQKLQKEGKINI